MAQRQLYDAWFGYGLSITMRYCADRHDAVATLHDAFVLVFRKLDRYDSSLDFRPWFRTIVVRAALDHLQAKRKTSTLCNSKTSFR
jgi:DNA-directed RNA polymerase specialized sigma subunit, sigma24 homolog